MNPAIFTWQKEVYSPEANDEKFALNMRAYVNIIGAEMDVTILEEPLGGAVFVYAWYDENFRFILHL